MKAFKVNVYSKYEEGYFKTREQLKRYLTGSEKGCLEIVRMHHRDLKGIYVGLVDADAEVKQQDYNPLATMISGVPIYGRMVICKRDRLTFSGLERQDFTHLIKIIERLIKG